MHKPTIIPVTWLPLKRFPHGYSTSELLRAEKRYRYHAERFNLQFYDDVAGNLRNGKMIPFPLGTKHREHPNSIRFEFEKHQFEMLLPDPHGADRRVIICTRTMLKSEVIFRAAHHFCDDFVVQYKRLYGDAIDQSKVKNGVG